MSFFSVINRASASLFYTLSHIRGKRVFHPYGVVCSGTLTIFPNAQSAVPAQLFQESKSLPIYVRLSSGLGLPSFLPDLLGCAIRILDCYGLDKHQDFLCITASKLPILRHALLPTQHFWHLPYTTILTYHVQKASLMFAVFPPSSPSSLPRHNIQKLSEQLPLSLPFAVATPLGDWTIIGEITLQTILPDNANKTLSFNPWNTGSDLQPAGFLNLLRRDTYKASQRGRSTV